MSVKTAPKWHILDAFKGCAYLMLLMYGMSRLTIYVQKEILVDPFVLYALIQLAETFFLIFISWKLSVYKYKNKFKDLGLVFKNFWRAATEGSLYGIAIFLIVVTAAVLLSNYYPFDSSPQPFVEILITSKSVQDIVLAVIMGVVLAPIGEEVFFRGFVYPAFKKKMGAALGILVTSLIFASFHLDLYRLIPIFLGGVALNFIYERKKSILYPIFAHSCWNGIMISWIYIEKVFFK